MISDKTQEKLDRASEGLPTDDEQQQIEAEIAELNKDSKGVVDKDLLDALGLKEEDLYDEVDEEAANDAFREAQYESSREDEHTNE